MSANAELLNQLKIDRSDRGTPSSGGALKWVLAIVAVAALALIAWVFWPRDAAPLVVQSAIALSAAEGVKNASVLDASGYITARRIATVSSKTTGKVEEVLIEEGMRVEAGQIMARLESIDIDRGVALARAQLAQAQSQLSEIQVNLANAQRNVDRLSELKSKQLVSAQVLDDAVAQLDALKARLASQRSSVTVSSRVLAQRDQDVENLVIRAPFAGVVIAKSAQAGEIISPLSAGGGFTRTGVGTIVDMDSLEIQVDVSESYINLVQPGQPVQAVLNAYPDWKIPATVIAIIPTADRTKATVKVRIAINEKDARIVPDMGVRVAFLNANEQRDDAPPRPGVLVPRAAVVDGKVWVIDNGIVAMRAVSVGDKVGGQLQITEGLKLGERVVLDPPAGLKAGAAVSF